jgi:DNA-binding response OmpR family regulator
MSPGAKVPKVIVITALDDAANRVIGKLQGVFHYMIKPVVPEELEAEVSRALADLAS